MNDHGFLKAENFSTKMPNQCHAERHLHLTAFGAVQVSEASRTPNGRLFGRNKRFLRVT